MSNTIVIGTTFVDIKGFSEGQYDPRSRNLGRVKIVHGGVGRNVAENFANVGMPVSYVGMLEDSVIGHDVERHLLEAGVNLDHTLKTLDNGVGLWMAILDEKGDLAGSISKMPDLSHLEKFILQQGEKIISAAKAVVLEIDLSERIAEATIKLAQKHKKRIYSVVGNMSVVLARKDLVKQTNCFICNEIEASKFFAQPNIVDFSPKQMLDFLPSAAKKSGIISMVVTMGEKGSVYFDGNTSTSGICRPCPTKVVDTSGAGDAFFSGTIIGLIMEKPLSEATQYGARLASATISREETSCPVNKTFFDA